MLHDRISAPLAFTLIIECRALQMYLRHVDAPGVYAVQIFFFFFFMCVHVSNSLGVDQYGIWTEMRVNMVMASSSSPPHNATSNLALTAFAKLFQIVQPSLQCGGRVQLSGQGGAVARQGNKGPPEVINLDDDSDLPDESSDDDDDDDSLTKNGGIISSTTDAKTPSPAVPMAAATTNKEGGEAVAV